MVGDPDGAEPPFAYTIGLWQSHAAPELIVFGLDFDLMHNMLSELVRRIASGARIADGARWDGLLESTQCVTRRVHPSQVRREWFNSATWYHEHAGSKSALDAFQVVWPGAYQKLFPWEDGCAAEVIAAQPPLWLPVVGKGL